METAAQVYKFTKKHWIGKKKKSTLNPKNAIRQHFAPIQPLKISIATVKSKLAYSCRVITIRRELKD
jgi:hypothetical protein